MSTTTSFPVRLYHFFFDRKSKRLVRTLLNPYQPKAFGVKFSLREILRIFSIELRNFKLCEMPRVLILGFQRGDIFFMLQYWTKNIL